MSLLVTSQLRFLRRAPWSALTALAGVALGVASVVAVHLISARVEASLAAATAPHLRGMTHLLERDPQRVGAGSAADAYFRLRRAWRAHPDSPIDALVPIVEGQVNVAGRSALLVGVDWLALPAGTPWGTSDARGADLGLLTGETVLADVLLDTGQGGTISLGGRDYQVAGVVDGGLGPALFADIAVAQRLLGTGPQALTGVAVRVDDPWRVLRNWLDGLMPGLSAGLPRADPGALADLPGGAELDLADLAAWRVRTVDALQPSATFARAILFNLGALGTVALLVAWFLIHQVAVIWVRRQRLVLQRLRVLGAAEDVLRRPFLLVFGGFGGIATVLGLGVGVWLASSLVSVSADGAGLADELPVVAVDGWVLAKAAVSGLGVCLLGAWGAFSHESRGASAPASTTAPARWGLVAALLLVTVAGLGWPGSGLLGGFAAILALCLLAVLTVRPLLGWLRRLAALPIAWPARLALRDVAMQPGLLTVAIAALVLAVATSIGVGVMVASFRADFDRLLAVRLAGDVYVYDVGGRGSALRGWLEARPEVAGVTAFGSQRLPIGGVPVTLGYARFDAREAARYGHDRALGRSEALVSERVLDDFDVAVGERLPGSPGLVVVGVFPGFGDPMARVLVDLASLPELAVTPRFDRLSVLLNRTTDLPERLREAFPGVDVEPRAELRAMALETFDRTFAITQALTALALIVAIVGMYNALTALRLQQTGTLRLLTAQGASSGQLRTIAVGRAVTAGGFAVLLALPLGLAMAWALCAVINPRSFGWTVNLHLPVAGWLPPVLLGLLAALLAGLLPAPREQGALHDAD